MSVVRHTVRFDRNESRKQASTVSGTATLFEVPTSVLPANRLAGAYRKPGTRGLVSREQWHIDRRRSPMT